MADKKKREELEEKKKSLRERREKIEEEYYEIKKRNEEVQNHIDAKSSRIKRMMEDPMVTSDPDLVRFYSDKAEKLAKFNESESEFRYNIDKEVRKLNEEIDLEEEDIDREISRIDDSDDEDEEENQEESEQHCG